MASFFKTFGKGVLAVVLIPVFLVVLVLFAIFGLLGFIYMSLKSVVLFFTGRKLNDDLPEDKKAKETIARLSHQITNENYSNVVNPQPQPQTIKEQDPFYIPEYMKDDIPVQTKIEETPIQETKPVEPIQEVEENNVIEPELEQPEIREELVTEEEPQNTKEGGFDSDFDQFIPNSSVYNNYENIRESSNDEDEYVKPGDTNKISL